MDNFHFIDVKPAIDRKETASIRDAIFKRAKEKAEALTEEKSEKYTSQVQSDVMDIARESIQASPMNPFNQFLDNIKQQNNIIVEEKPVQKETPKFGKLYKKELKRNIESASNETFENSVKNETMTEARNQFRQGTNLMATLNFLNTQAAIKMAENAHSKIKVNFSA